MLINCPRIILLLLEKFIEHALGRSDVVSLLAIIAWHGLNLKEFKLGACKEQVVHLYPEIAADIIEAINRIDNFQVDIDIRNRADVSIFTYPHVRPQIGDVDTSYHHSNDAVAPLMMKSRIVHRVDSPPIRR
jgi:hypothetical protein